MVEFQDPGTNTKVWVNPDHVRYLTEVPFGVGECTQLNLTGGDTLFVKGTAAEVVGKLQGWHEQVMQGIYGEPGG